MKVLENERVRNREREGGAGEGGRSVEREIERVGE